MLVKEADIDIDTRLSYTKHFPTKVLSEFIVKVWLALFCNQYADTKLLVTREIA